MSRFRFWSDAQWDLIGAFLPGPTGRTGRPSADARTKVEGIVYRYRTVIGPLSNRDRLAGSACRVRAATNVTRHTGFPQTARIGTHPSRLTME